MCGIAGVYQYRTGEPVKEQVLRDMLRIIRHRGPDDDGVYFDGKFAMGMRRLSIIDLSGGKQPIWNEDRSVGIVSIG